MALPFRPVTRRNSRGLDRPTATYERVVLEDDPLARFSSNILLNYSSPDLSPLLLAPLAREAGGRGVCGDVFRRTDDRDYQKLLTAIRSGKAILDEKPRYGDPDFQPNPQYIREMKKYGVLPPTFDASDQALDIFDVDQAYWRTFWRRSRR
jgi:hypothetical protein